MAKSKFVPVGELKELTKQDALTAATQKAAERAEFVLDANTEEVLTCTGKVFERAWERRNAETNVVESSGTSLLIETKKSSDNSLLNVPLGYFFDKKRKGEGGETQIFKGCFRNMDFEGAIKFAHGRKSVKVARGDYFREGWSTPTEITTVQPA